MEPEKDPKIEFTAEELSEAVSCYDLLTPEETTEACRVLTQCPELGVRVAQCLKEAAKEFKGGKNAQIHILGAAIVPAFLIGFLAGFSRKLQRDFLETPSFDDQMAMLEKCVDRRVRIKYAEYGRVFQLDCVLSAVEPYLLLRTENGSLPFIGSGIAIRRVSAVTDHWEQSIYLNPKIPLDYDVRRDADVEKLKAECFGPLPPLEKKA